MALFGLIGYPLTHSFSKKYFTEKFEREGLTEHRYELFPLKKIEELPRLFRSYPLMGLNVTIPYKIAVREYLTHFYLPEGLEAINCIRINDKKLEGFNTDYVGFKQSFEPLLQTHHTKALVLGTGGAAAAIKFVLQQIGLEFTTVSRTKENGDLVYEEITDDVITSHPVIINTTPLGTYPRIEECPDIPYQAIRAEHLLYDVVYNPATSLFLEKGKERGAAIKNGEEMLIIQAEESWRIWNS